MSTIASGVLGPLQGQAPSKGKAGHGHAGASEKGDFALTIASLHARGGEGEGKGGRASISGGAQGEDKAEHASDTRTNAAHAATLRKAVAAADAGGNASFNEKLASLADKAEWPDRKTSAEGRESAKAAALKAGKRATTGEPDATGEAAAEKAPPSETDVGNLLELLAAPVGLSGSMPHGAVANAAVVAAASGMAQDAKAQAGGRVSAKADLPGDGASGAKASHLLDAADAGDMPQSDADRLFRLVRADGKGRDLDMSISGAGDRASLRDANPTGPKGETVTVVDARRYIGLAQTGNAAAVTSAITQDPEWTASLSATGGLTSAEAAATGKVVNTLKIQMNPIELGLVTATLRLHGDDLVVSLQVETGEAYRQLRDDQDAIVRALRSQGFTVDQVTVQLAPADRGAGAQQGDGQSQQSQQQFSNQPQAREGGNGREQRGGEGAGTFGREGRSHEGNTSDTAPGLAGSQSVRSGGVYL